MIEKKPIECKCGRLLGYATRNTGARTKVCPSCKRRIRYEVSRTSTSITVHVSYV